jgi:murein DD-endopeptidase MepM/ murein hydrolase activator NlpD
MKRLIELTESDLKKIVRKVIRESKLNEAVSTPQIPIDDLDNNNIILPSSVRGATYGWRGPIHKLCRQGKKRYCNYHWHAGRDYAGGTIPVGTPIALLKKGTVYESGYPDGFCFKLEHVDGSKTKFCHCQTFNYNVGDTINAGEIIAYLGNKGPSTGPHLHFEYYPNESIRTETKNGITVNVNDTDPSGYDEEIFTFVKKDKLNDFETEVESIEFEEPTEEPYLDIEDPKTVEMGKSIERLVKNVSKYY